MSPRLSPEIVPEITREISRDCVANHDEPPPRAGQRDVEPAVVGQEADSATAVGADRREDDELLLSPLETVHRAHLHRLLRQSGVRRRKSTALAPPSARAPAAAAAAALASADTAVGVASARAGAYY